MGLTNIMNILNEFNRWDMNSYRKKMATGRDCRFAKPRARPLRAEVPCNYIHGRLAAAL